MGRFPVDLSASRDMTDMLSLLLSVPGSGSVLAVRTLTLSAASGHYTLGVLEQGSSDLGIMA